MSVDLTLGPRPEEPGSPIGGPSSYSAEVTERLASLGLQLPEPEPPPSEDAPEDEGTPNDNGQ